MKKDVIRREAIKLKHAGKKYPIISLLLKERYDYKVTPRTLKRWFNRFEQGNWNFKDNSKKPKRLHYKFTDEDKQQIIRIRKQTGWGCDNIRFNLQLLNISRITINRVLDKYNLC